MQLYSRLSGSLNRESCSQEAEREEEPSYMYWKDQKVKRSSNSGKYVWVEGWYSVLSVSHHWCEQRKIT